MTYAIYRPDGAPAVPRLFRDEQSALAAADKRGGALCVVRIDVMAGETQCIWTNGIATTLIDSRTDYAVIDRWTAVAETGLSAAQLETMCVRFDVHSLSTWGTGL